MAVTKQISEFHPIYALVVILNFKVFTANEQLIPSCTSRQMQMAFAIPLCDKALNGSGKWQRKMVAKNGSKKRQRRNVGKCTKLSNLIATRH